MLLAMTDKQFRDQGCEQTRRLMAVVAATDTTSTAADAAAGAAAADVHLQICSSAAPSRCTRR